MDRGFEQRGKGLLDRALEAAFEKAGGEARRGAEKEGAVFTLTDRDDGAQAEEVGPGALGSQHVEQGVPQLLPLLGVAPRDRHPGRNALRLHRFTIPAGTRRLKLQPDGATDHLRGLTLDLGDAPLAECRAPSHRSHDDRIGAPRNAHICAKHICKHLLENPSIALGVCIRVTIFTIAARDI